jgi:acetyl esterase/lipase
MTKYLIGHWPYIAMTVAAALIVVVCALGPIGFTQQNSYTSYLDLEYANVNSTSLKLDLYVPNTGGPFPVVIWVHGGGWQTGDKSDPTPAIREVNRGYAVVSINYRLQILHPAPLDPNLVFPVQIQDCKAAVRWLRANAGLYNLDPNRIGAWGESAGGHLSSLLGTSGGVTDLENLNEGNASFSSRVTSVVDWYGPTDFLQMDAQSLPECGPVCHNCAESPESYLIGCALQTCPALTQRANPISYVTQDDAAFLIMHGTADCQVPAGQSQLLYNALQGRGLDVAINFVQGAGHGGPEFTDPVLLAQVDAFFDRTLGGGSPTPTPTPSPGAIVLNPSSLNLTTTAGVDPANQQIDVTSSSNWTASTSTSWLRTHCTTGNCGGSFFVVQTVTSGLRAGSYSGSVQVTSNSSSVVLPVTLTITGGPTPTPTPTPMPTPTPTPRPTPTPTPTPTPCLPAVNPSSISIRRGNGSAAVAISLSGAGSGTVSKGSSPVNLTVTPTSQVISAGGSAVFTISSNKNTRGNFTVNFTTPCGSTSVIVSVTN